MSKVQLIVDSVTDHNAVCTKTDRNDVTVPQNLEYWILPPKGNPKGLYGGVRSAAEPSECSPAGFPAGGNIQYLKKRGTVISQSNEG